MSLQSRLIEYRDGNTVLEGRIVVDDSIEGPRPGVLVSHAWGGRSDFEDGSLEQLLISGHPLALVALAKVLVHWLVAGLPIVLLSPLLAMWMNLPDGGMSILIETLIIGTPILSLIGAIGGALTVSLKRGGQLLSLLVFPLFVPLLIVATNAVSAAVAGLPYTGQLGLMGAYLLLVLKLAPFATAAALKLSLS